MTVRPGASTGRRLAFGAGLNLAASGANALATFAVIVLAGRRLGATTAGEIFQVAALFSILTVVLQWGTGSGLVRAVARSATSTDRAAVTHIVLSALVPVTGVSVAIAALVAATRNTTAGILAQPQDQVSIAVMLLVAAAFLPVSVVSASLLSVSRGMGSLVVYPVAENVVKPITRLALVASVVTVDPSPKLIGVAWFAPTIGSLFLGAYSVVAGISRMEDEPSRTTGPLTRREFWSFSLRQSLADVSFVGVGWLDLVLLGAMTSSAAAGVYGVVGRYLFLEEMGLVAVATVLAPEFSALFATQYLVRLRELYKATTLWLVTLVVPLIVTLAWFAALLLSIAGPSFKAGESALAILSAGIVLDNAAGPIVAALSMGGRSGSVLVAAAISLAANIALNILLIPPYGLVGAAIAWAVSIQIINLVSLYRCWRLWDLHPAQPALGRSVLGAIACFSLASSAAIAWLGQTWIGLCVAATAGACLYAPVVWTFRGRLSVPRHRIRAVAVRGNSLQRSRP